MNRSRSCPLLVAALAMSCSDGDFEIRKTRQTARRARLHATMEERLGFMAPRRSPVGHPPIGTAAESGPGAGPAAGPAASAAGERATPASGPLHWDTPPGWTERNGAGGMRLVSFALPDGAECYLVFLAGNGGGALKNVNRWRAQLGQAPIDEAGLRVLERVQMLGAQRPMLEAYSREGQGMLATLADGGERTLFVKLIGTEAAVRSQIPGFRALCKSLRFSK